MMGSSATSRRSRPGGPCTVSGRSRPCRLNVLSMPGRPSTWSAWKWVMNTSPSSTSPTERTSWRWVPSPQSKSILSPPRCTRIAGSPRRAVGAEPAVPRKSTSRFMARLSKRHELEPDVPLACARNPHGRVRRPPPLGGTTRVEDLEAVALLVEGHVRMAEDHRMGVGEADTHPVDPPPARAGVVDHRDTGAVRLHHTLGGKLVAQLDVVHIAMDSDHRRADRLEVAKYRGGHHVTGVKDE